jgi:hypothetical protein
VRPRRPPRPTPPDPEVVVVHTSIRGLLAAFATPVLLVALGLLGWSGIGARPVPLTFLLVGAALGAVVLFDYPSRVEFDRNGVHRVCPLRRQSLPWERVRSIERPRPSSIATLRNLRERPDEPLVSGGLIARSQGRRRWLLTDRVESREEYDRLRDLLIRLGSPAGCVLRAPTTGSRPPSLYRHPGRRNVGA